MTPNVSMAAPIPKSKSRKVNAYVKAALRYRALRANAERAHTEMLGRGLTLNGTQTAEAARRLREKAWGTGTGENDD